MDHNQQAHLLDLIGDELSDLAASRVPGVAIARLLDLHLSALDGWSGRWMDDLLDARLTVEGTRSEVLAFVVWGKGGTTAQWMDPLHAAFVRDSDGKISHYELRFCDECQPSQPYKLHRKFEPSANHSWLYHFTVDAGGLPNNGSL